MTISDEVAAICHQIAVAKPDSVQELDELRQGWVNKIESLAIEEHRGEMALYRWASSIERVALPDASDYGVEGEITQPDELRWAIEDALDAIRAITAAAARWRETHQS